MNEEIPLVQLFAGEDILNVNSVAEVEFVLLSVMLESGNFGIKYEQ